MEPNAYVSPRGKQLEQRNLMILKEKNKKVRETKKYLELGRLLAICLHDENDARRMAIRAKRTCSVDGVHKFLSRFLEYDPVKWDDIQFLEEIREKNLSESLHSLKFIFGQFKPENPDAAYHALAYALQRHYKEKGGYYGLGVRASEVIDSASDLRDIRKSLIENMLQD